MDDALLLLLAEGHLVLDDGEGTFEPIPFSESDSALLRGDPTWNSYETDKALRCRVHDVYWESGSEVQPVSGTWLWEPAPQLSIAIGSLPVGVVLLSVRKYTTVDGALRTTSMRLSLHRLHFLATLSQRGCLSRRRRAQRPTRTFGHFLD